METNEKEPELSIFSQGLLMLSGAVFLAVAGLIVFKASKLAVQIAGLASSSKSEKKVQGHSKDEKPPQSTPQDTKVNKKHQADLKTLIKQSKAAEKAKKAGGKDDMSSHHHLFVATLKGHADVVNGVGWSKDALQLTTACSDLQVRMFDLVPLATGKSPTFKFFRTRRTPLGAGYGDTSSQVVVLLQEIPNEAAMEMYKFVAPGADPNTPSGWVLAWQVPKLHGKEAPMCMVTLPGTQGVVGDSGSGPRTGLAVSLSKKKDVRILDFQGRQVGVAEPNSLDNHNLAVSQNSRFLAVASFTADVKIWELNHSRDGFKGTSKVMDLKGHSSQVMAVALSPDGRRAATASKDGTLRVWNTDVRYHMNEDPKALIKVPLQLPASKCYQHMAFSADGTLAASLVGRLHLIDTASGKLLEDIDAHDEEITAMHWSPEPLRFNAEGHTGYVLATCSKDRKVRLWSSPAAV